MYAFELVYSLHTAHMIARQADAEINLSLHVINVTRIFICHTEITLRSFCCVQFVIYFIT